VLAISDTLVLASCADTTLLVVRWMRTDRGAARLGLNKLYEARARVAGAVISMVDPDKHAQYGFADSAYYYSSMRRYYTETKA
jgi:Mrp family chromosome partitioning ATPase